MCCFSRDIDYVRNTRIFTRTEDGIRQFVVYQMSFKAKEDLAMILPLPVRQGSNEQAVQFINLKEYPGFFQELNRNFPVPRHFIPGCSASETPMAALKPAALEVHEVGDYEASFVPTIADFKRLDERFRLADNVWGKLPQYQTFGFAVFKLKSGEHESHPLAFSFPRRTVGSLFFPTVHIHDGKVHEKADFDHTLYCQPSAGEKLDLRNWAESESLAKNFMNLEKTSGVIASDQHCYRLLMRGQLNNTDVYIRSV